MSEAEVEEQGADEEEQGADEDAPVSPQEPATDDEPFEDSAHPLLGAEAAAARDKALEREHKRHENALARVHGSEEWDLYTMCPLCIGDGFMTPYQPGEVEPEQWEAIQVLAAQLETIEYQQSSKHQTCQECDGRGETISGAKPPKPLLKLCDVCGGNGYVPKAPALPQPVPLPDLSNGTTIPVIPTSWGSPASNDQWGRAAGHPHYGMDPSLIGVG